MVNDIKKITNQYNTQLNKIISNLIKLNDYIQKDVLNTINDLSSIENIINTKIDNKIFHKIQIDFNDRQSIFFKAKRLANNSTSAQDFDFDTEQALALNLSTNNFYTYEYSLIKQIKNNHYFPYEKGHTFNQLENVEETYFCFISKIQNLIDFLQKIETYKPTPLFFEDYSIEKGEFIKKQQLCYKHIMTLNEFINDYLVSLWELNEPFENLKTITDLK